MAGRWASWSARSRPSTRRSPRGSPTPAPGRRARAAGVVVGEPSPLPELRVQYADFAVWQSSWLRGEVLEEEISFWRRQLAGLPPLLALPTDRPRPPGRR